MNEVKNYVRRPVKAIQWDGSQESLEAIEKLIGPRLDGMRLESDQLPVLIIVDRYPGMITTTRSLLRQGDYLVIHSGCHHEVLSEAGFSEMFALAKQEGTVGDGAGGYHANNHSATA